MKLFDSHAHLDFPQFEPDRGELLRDLYRQGIAVVNVGIDLETSRRSLELAAEWPNVFAACGIHPHNAGRFGPEEERELRLLLDRGAVAVGECGLDYYRNLSPKEAQIRAFRAQIRMAKELGLPLIMHLREAEGDFLGILEEERPEKGVVHAFSGDGDLARRLLDLGFHLGIGGPVTYRKNVQLRALLREIPLERLLVETDSPYLPPEPFRGKRNDPAKVRLVVLKIAEVLRRPPEEIAEITYENACRLFGVSPKS